MLIAEMHYTQTHCEHKCLCDKAHNFKPKVHKGMQKEKDVVPVTLFLSYVKHY